MSLSNRPSIDTVMLNIVQVLQTRATCKRRQVGCVLVNNIKHVIATGYNGVASGLAHCTDEPCPGSESGPGTSLYHCQAIHAEQNALLQCPDVRDIWTCYVSCSPCIQCTKLLLNTSCTRVVFFEKSSHYEEAYALWKKVKGPFSWHTWEELREFEGYSK